MIVSILCTDTRHPAYVRLHDACRARGWWIETRLADVAPSDFLFLVSCTQIVPAEARAKHRHVLVLHESDLPKGRGWSPAAWQVLEGASRIPVCLLEAEDAVDSGRIWGKLWVALDGTELADEIAAKLLAAKLDLMDAAVAGAWAPKRQRGEPTFYRRRTPEDSRLDPKRSIAAQFGLLRICEPRFPAFFEHRGCRYEISIRKADE